MLKIRSITFRDHPILKNLTLDFCDANGNAVDTVIIAGENGTGKSTILNFLYDITSRQVLTSAVYMVVESEGKKFQLTFTCRPRYTEVRDNAGLDTVLGSENFEKKYNLHGIYSDVDINFQAPNVSSVTSMSLDASSDSRRSQNDLPKQIKQLIIDVQDLDDAELSKAVRESPNKSKNELQVVERMPRFTEAFAFMFEGLQYYGIDNVDGHKEIYFKKNGQIISIDSLSSGEKQVVYRGCFLMKDVNATNGALVFIDEPEISLHPLWQKKILDYYKRIFTDKDGNQTSQIFAVTHSPFVIHNEWRKNDKVIILARDENGDIVVKDKPEYFKCDSIAAVEDAFQIKNFSSNQSTVYLEGRTDEMYFNRAVAVFGMQLPFAFKWIGYIEDNGQEENTGETNLDAAFRFLVSKNLNTLNVCLKDCDTKRQQKEKNNVVIMSMPYYENAKGMKKGIENALVLDNVDTSLYYSSERKMGDYGEEKVITRFEKMKFCKDICAMNDAELKVIFSNLKKTIDELVEIYAEHQPR